MSRTVDVAVAVYADGLVLFSVEDHAPFGYQIRAVSADTGRVVQVLYCGLYPGVGSFLAARWLEATGCELEIGHIGKGSE